MRDAERDPGMITLLLSQVAHLLEAVSVIDPSFRGLSVDGDGMSLQVWRAGVEEPSPLVDRAYRTVVPDGVSLNYKCALFTQTQVDEITAVVKGLLPRLDAEGFFITLAGQPRNDQPYRIGYDPVDAVIPADLAAHFARFGAGNVVFRPGGASNGLDTRVALGRGPR